MRTFMLTMLFVVGPCEIAAAHYSHAHAKSRHHRLYRVARPHRSPIDMNEFCRGNDNIEYTTACAPYKS
jgi:hypothetical protein